MMREDDKAEEEITDGEVQEDSPCFCNTDEGSEYDDHDSAGTTYCLSFVVKNFHCFTCLLSFHEKHLQLPAFTIFYSTHVKNFAKNFHGCTAIRGKLETFSPRIISNIMLGIYHVLKGVQTHRW